MSKKHPLSKNQKGFTVVEILVALSILLLVASSMVPLFVFASRNAQFNRVRTVATNLANRDLEKIRNLPYDEVGVNPGNPSGTLARTEDVVVGNLTYHIERKVRWVDDAFDGLYPVDTLPADYKRVTVAVSCPALDFISSVTVSTAISRSGEETLLNRGNIRTHVLNFNEEPVTGAQVDITAGPSAPSRDWTEADGVVFFPALSPSSQENDYAVTVTKDGYISLETQPLTTTVTVDNTSHIFIHLDVPGDLIVHVVDPDGNPIENAEINLSRAAINPFERTSADGNFSVDDLFPGAWEIIADADGFRKTTQPIPVQINSRETSEVTVTLERVQRGNFHLEVFDADTQQRINGQATVKITNQETNEVINNQTNTNGILEQVRLEYGTYTVEVSKGGYYTSSNNSVTISSPGNTSLDVFLEPEPQVGSILIRTERNNSSPRNNTWVRVVGNGYDQMKLTSSAGAGQALFANLNPGAYHTYRWTWSWSGGRWIDERVVSVTAGNQTTVIYRY